MNTKRFKQNPTGIEHRLDGIELSAATGGFTRCGPSGLLACYEPPAGSSFLQWSRSHPG